MAKRLPSAADLKHRVSLCSQRDEVRGNAALVLNRVKIFDTWAAINPKSPSAFSRDGFVVKDAQDQQTHEIYIRYRANFDISVAAWVYEERRKSAPRWFRVIRVINVNEAGEWLCLKAKIYESSDAAPEPEKEKPAIIDVATQLPRGFGA